MGKQVSTMRILIGLWLAFLYAVCISGVVVSLTLFQFQHKILATPERPPQPEDTMVFHQCILDGLKVSDIGKGGTHSLACIPVKTSINQGFQSPAKILELLNSQGRYVAGKAEESKDKQNYLKTLRDTDPLGEKIDRNLREQFRKLEKLKLEIKEIDEKQDFARAAVLTDEFEKAESDLKSDISLLQVGQEGEIEERLKTEFELEKEIRKIDAEIESFRAQSAHLVDVKADIAFYSKFFPDVVDTQSPFWAAPFHLLTLVLILSMGALGSLIFLTNDFLERDNAEEKFSMYIFRPLLGMALAFSIFVMFKSGQSLLGIDPVQRQSPFFIAFIGLISGLLAEKAYRRITLEGEKLFAIEEAVPDSENSGSGQAVKRSAK